MNYGVFGLSDFVRLIPLAVFCYSSSARKITRELNILEGQPFSISEQSNFIGNHFAIIFIFKPKLRNPKIVKCLVFQRFLSQALFKYSPLARGLLLNGHLEGDSPPLLQSNPVDVKMPCNIVLQFRAVSFCCCQVVSKLSLVQLFPCIVFRLSQNTLGIFTYIKD